jgi:hypothetical protein
MDVPDLRNEGPNLGQFLGPNLDQTWEQTWGANLGPTLGPNLGPIVSVRGVNRTFLTPRSLFARSTDTEWSFHDRFAIGERTIAAVCASAVGFCSTITRSVQWSHRRSCRWRWRKRWLKTQGLWIHWEPIHRALELDSQA